MEPQVPVCRFADLRFDVSALPRVQGSKWLPLQSVKPLTVVLLGAGSVVPTLKPLFRAAASVKILKVDPAE